jgi:tetratricopeptide (TPR) repeat protein
LRAGRYDEAVTDLTAALTVDPSYAWALAERGAAHLRAGRYDEAVTDYTAALTVDPSYAWALAERGAAHRRAGRYDEAITDYDEALRKDPGSASALSNRALTNHLLGDYNAAIADYTRLLEINPGDASALANRGYAYRLKKRYVTALADLDRALEIDPDHGSALIHRGLVHRLNGQYDAALADLTRAVELRPDEGWAHYECAVALHALRDPARDQAIARAVEILEPESASTEEALAVVPVLGNLFLIHCLMPHWDEADRYLTAFLAVQPPPGQLSELRAAMDSLVDVCPDADEHLTPFRQRLAGALAGAGCGIRRRREPGGGRAGLPPSR